MHKFWLVAKQEFRNRTFKRSFFIGTLIIPVIIALIIGVTIFVVERSIDDRPFGYVDYSGALANATNPKNDSTSVEIIAFKDEESARIALEI